MEYTVNSCYKYSIIKIEWALLYCTVQSIETIKSLELFYSQICSYLYIFCKMQETTTPSSKIASDNSII